MRRPLLIKIRYSLFVGSSLIVFLSSCATPKDLTYFQGTIPTHDTVSTPYSITLEPKDFLYIQVNSLATDTTFVHNPYPKISADPAAPPPANAVGYVVNKDGTVNLPLIGTLSVSGETTDQVADSIRVRLPSYLKMPTVIVRLPSLRVTILGEVNKPSTYTYNYYTMTLPQALGLAGDLTTYARRDNILIVRQKGNKRTYERIDLTKAEVFNSPYYWLKPNDVIYVSPSKARAASIDRTFQILPIVISALSLVGTIIIASK
jgi:polysaccharide export outer membrane protein